MTSPHEEEMVLVAKDLTERIVALEEWIDGGNPETDGLLLGQIDTLMDELGEVRRKLTLTIAPYEEWEPYDGDHVIRTAYGMIRKRWSGGSSNWDWDLIVPKMVSHVAEGYPGDAAVALIEQAMGEFRQMVGLTKSKAGRVKEFQKRGIWSDLYRTNSGGRNTFVLVPVTAGGDDEPVEENP